MVMQSLVVAKSQQTIFLWSELLPLVLPFKFAEKSHTLFEYLCMRQNDISVVWKNVYMFTMLQYGAKEKISNFTAHIDASFILSIASV